MIKNGIDLKNTGGYMSDNAPIHSVPTVHDLEMEHTEVMKNIARLERVHEEIKMTIAREEEARDRVARELSTRTRRIAEIEWLKIATRGIPKEIANLRKEIRVKRKNLTDENLTVREARALEISIDGAQRDLKHRCPHTFIVSVDTCGVWNARLCFICGLKECDGDYKHLQNNERSLIVRQPLIPVRFREIFGLPTARPWSFGADYSIKNSTDWIHINVFHATMEDIHSLFSYPHLPL